MQSNQSASGFDHIHRLLATKGPMTTASVAAATGLDSSTVSRHLNAMVIGGLAVRHRRGRVVEYTATRNLYISFTGPLGKGSTGRSVAWDRLTWRTDQPVNWRFPLTTRVADPEGQRTLLRLLQRFDNQGMFHPWLSFKGIIDDWTHNQPEHMHDELRRVFRDPSLWGPYHVIVYGSCARGDARDDSDLDVLIVGPAPENWNAAFKSRNLPPPPFPEWQSQFKEKISEINLGSARYVDAIIEEESHIVDLPKGLLGAIVRDGLTVYTSTGYDFSIEAWRLQNGK